jgi:hypothetical protein
MRPPWAAVKPISTILHLCGDVIGMMDALDAERAVVLAMTGVPRSRNTALLRRPVSGDRPERPVYATRLRRRFPLRRCSMASISATSSNPGSPTRN